MDDKNLFNLGFLEDNFKWESCSEAPRNWDYRLHNVTVKIPFSKWKTGDSIKKIDVSLNYGQIHIWEENEDPAAFALSIQFRLLGPRNNHAKNA